MLAVASMRNNSSSFFRFLQSVKKGAPAVIFREAGGRVGMNIHHFISATFETALESYFRRIEAKDLQDF
jgi:hypothetical protein